MQIERNSMTKMAVAGPGSLQRGKRMSSTMSTSSRPVPAVHCCNSAVGPSLAEGSSEAGSNAGISSLTMVAVPSGRGTANDRLQGSEAPRASALAPMLSYGGQRWRVWQGWATFGEYPRGQGSWTHRGSHSHVRAAAAHRWRPGHCVPSLPELHPVSTATAAAASSTGAAVTAGTTARTSGCF